MLALNDALEQLARLDSRQTQMIELRYFAGLNETQVAELLGVSRRTISRETRVARIWLRKTMRD